LPALTLGKLPGGRGRQAIPGIDDAGAIADGPHVAAALEPQVAFGEEPAFFLGRIQPGDHRGRGAANGADNGPAVHKFIRQAHAVAGCQRHARIEFDGDSGGFHLRPGKLPQPRTDFREQLVAGMDERHGQVFRADVGEETQAAAQEVVDFAGGFHAAVTAADHDEREKPALPRGIVAHFGFFQLLEHVGAQDRGVAHGLEREGMVGHAGHDVEI
jgi:hypothetical protein